MATISKTAPAQKLANPPQKPVPPRANAHQKIAERTLKSSLSQAPLLTKRAVVQKQGALKAILKRNFFAALPTAIHVNVLAPMLSGIDIANFRQISKSTPQVSLASILIKKYGLQPLLERYLHLDFATLSEAGKSKALHEILSIALEMNSTEKMPYPTYPTLKAFFEVAEARNLLRMAGQFNDEGELSNCIAAVGDFTIPAEANETLEKANRLRAWLRLNSNALVNITLIDFDAPKLTLLPPEIGLFFNLTVLGLRENRLCTLPKEIGQLKALKDLNVCGNNLYVLPREIGRLRSLQELRLSGNRLTTLPDTIGRLNALKIFFIEHNKLTHLPRQIGKLQNLENFRVVHNRLGSLPKEISKLIKLKIFYVSKNRLIRIPNEIVHLVALDKFRVDNNLLFSLPKEFAKRAVFYNEFWAFNNGLVELPEPLNSHEKYQTILLGQNNFLQLQNILHRLMLCIRTKNDPKTISPLLKKIDLLDQPQTRSKLHKCLFDICNRVWKHPSLRQKLKERNFARNAFLDPRFPAKLKIAALELSKYLLDPSSKKSSPVPSKIGGNQ